MNYSVFTWIFGVVSHICSHVPSLDRFIINSIFHWQSTPLTKQVLELGDRRVQSFVCQKISWLQRERYESNVLFLFACIPGIQEC